MAESSARWVGILQPGYLPWQGFFEQMDRVDLFILLDDVQYTSRDWRNRNRILAGTGPIWLTVPVEAHVAGVPAVRAPICQVAIDNAQDWARRHLRAIELAYRRAPYYDTYIGGLRDIYSRSYRLLVDLDEALRQAICDWLGVTTPVVRSATMPTDAAGSDRILALCRQVGATDYYSGPAARAYLDIGRFAACGIDVWFQSYSHQPYPQRHGHPFVSHLSVIDLLFNLGPGSLAHIRAGARDPERG